MVRIASRCNDSRLSIRRRKNLSPDTLYRIPKFTMNLETLKIQIVDTFRPLNPEKIILFGSAARGDWDEESDVDVIVVYETDKSFLDRLKELYRSWQIPKAVDILAYTPTEYAEMLSEKFFFQDAVKDGELIYERM